MKSGKKKKKNTEEKKKTKKKKQNKKKKPVAICEETHVCVYTDISRYEHIIKHFMVRLKFKYVNNTLCIQGSIPDTRCVYICY